MGYGKIKQKRFLLVFCIICLLGPVLAGCIFDETGSFQLSVPALAADKLQKMLGEDYREYKVKPELYFGGQALPYDGADDIYYISQSMDAGSWNGALNSSEGELYWQKDSYFSEFADALAEGHLFLLYCVNEDTREWCSYRVVFSGMPAMVIETQDGGMIGDHTSEAEMRIFDLKFPGRDYVSVSCQTRVRGGTSRGFEKKGYKLVLDEKQSLLGMRKDDDWILAALYDDAGLIHNKFSYDVWREMASHNSVSKDDGTTMEYVELFCNDIYMGVYGLTERIDAKELSLGETQDILYKCYGPELPDESQDWIPVLSKAYGIKYPSVYETDDWMPLQEYLEVFTAQDGITDYEQAVSMINMENALDHNLFIMLSYGCDNHERKNTFYLAEWGGNADPGYTMIKVPWDCNATWGNFWRHGEEFNNTIYEPERITDPNLWSKDMQALFLCRPDEIGALLRERWAGLRRDVLSRERLVHMLDEEFSYLHGSGAYDRNFRRWPNGTAYWDDSYIYEYVEGRLRFLDDYLEAPYLDEEPALDY